MVSDGISSEDSCSRTSFSTSDEGVTCAEALQSMKRLQSLEYTEHILDDGKDGAQVLVVIMSQLGARRFLNCKPRVEGEDAGHEAAEVDSSNRHVAADKDCL